MRALTEQDYLDAAKQLDVEPAVIKAVAEVESRGDGFLESGEPVILFERHIFRRLTNKAFDGKYPYLSNKTPGGYGKSSAQHSRLQEAVTLNREAALQSCSWGKFQVLGMNWKPLGYSSLQEFVNAMYESEAAHLDSFIRFVKANGLTQYLRDHEWAEFARRYNGPAYKKHNYHGRLATAYKKHKGA